VKRKLNRKIYPIKAPTPIQYQFACGKTPRDFKTKTPNTSEELGDTYNKNISTYLIIDQNLFFNFLL
jgi:hypothetical protein